MFFLEDNLMEWILGKIIYIIVVAILCLIIEFIVDRENRTKNNKEKILLRLLMISGNLVIFGIIILCLWAGFSYIQEGNMKAVIGLFVTAILLGACLGVSIYKKVKHF